jgi:hypothetical protein
MSDVERVERLLRSALVPVDPPEALGDRLERGLAELTEAAATELGDWELSAMRDPRNWAPIVVRARQQHKKRQVPGLQALEKSLRGVAGDVQKRLRR